MEANASSVPQVNLFGTAGGDFQQFQLGWSLQCNYKREREASQALMPVTYIQFASETLDLVHWLSLRGPCPVYHRILDSKLVFKARYIRARCTYVEVKVQL